MFLMSEMVNIYWNPPSEALIVFVYLHTHKCKTDVYARKHTEWERIDWLIFISLNKLLFFYLDYT